MRIPRKVIETSLKQKGFVQDNRDHRKFFLYYKGKKTGIFTYTSHGSKYKDIGDGLISIMKRQLQLQTKRQKIYLGVRCQGMSTFKNLLGAIS